MERYKSKARTVKKKLLLASEIALVIDRPMQAAYGCDGQVIVETLRSGIAGLLSKLEL